MTWLKRVIGLAVIMGALTWLAYAVSHGIGTPPENEAPLSAPSLIHTGTIAPSTRLSPTSKPTASSTPTIAPSPMPSPAPKRRVSPTATVTSRPSPQPTTALTPSLTPIPTRPPTFTPTLTPSPTVSGTIASPLVDVPPCASPSFSSHLWLACPIPPEANDRASTYYPYGSTAGGEYLIHHGVDFVNAEGTPVWAAGAGTVLYAGNDRERVFGPQPDFYGQLVILRMDREYHGQPLFTLYGHLSVILVEEGQRVEVGQKLGEVGETGIALGPHLHFEVRVTDAEGYNATRNPDLWLRPHPGRGLITGQVFNGAGHRLPEVPLVLYPADDREHPQSEGWTYAGQGVNPDEEWLENLVLGDVPAGEWAVVAYVSGHRLRQRVSVDPGEISWVCLQVPAGPAKASP